MLLDFPCVRYFESSSHPSVLVFPTLSLPTAMSTSFFANLNFLIHRVVGCRRNILFCMSPHTNFLFRLFFSSPLVQLMFLTKGGTEFPPVKACWVASVGPLFLKYRFLLCPSQRAIPFVPPFFDLPPRCPTNLWFLPSRV